MKARWRTPSCPRCTLPIEVGDEIKRRFVMRGLDTHGKPIYHMTDEWQHASCRKPKAPRQPRFDPETGEILS